MVIPAAPSPHPFHPPTQQDPDESFGADSFEFTSGTGEDFKSGSLGDPEAPVPMPGPYLAMLRGLAAGVGPDTEATKRARCGRWIHLPAHACPCLCPCTCPAVMCLSVHVHLHTRVRVCVRACAFVRL